MFTTNSGKDRSIKVTFYNKKMFCNNFYKNHMFLFLPFIGTIIAFNPPKENVTVKAEHWQWDNLSLHFLSYSTLCCDLDQTPTWKKCHSVNKNERVKRFFHFPFRSFHSRQNNGFRCVTFICASGRNWFLLIKSKCIYESKNRGNRNGVKIVEDNRNTYFLKSFLWCLFLMIVRICILLL